MRCISSICGVTGKVNRVHERVCYQYLQYFFYPPFDHFFPNHHGTLFDSLLLTYYLEHFLPQFVMQYAVIEVVNFLNEHLVDGLDTQYVRLHVDAYEFPHA